MLYAMKVHFNMECIYFINNYRKHGEGRLTLSNGEVFAGSFVNNVVDGYGAF